MIDAFKEFAPILTGITGLLVAFLSGFFFKKNKQTEYSMKLAEIAVEKVYNRALVFIEDSVNYSDGYEGLTLNEVQKIKEIFLKHRHLVDDMLWNMIWSFEEEYRNREEYFELNKIHLDEKAKEYKYDQNREFLERLKFVRKKHLKNLGFSTYMKPNVLEVMMITYERVQKDFRRYKMQRHKKKTHKRINKQ